MQKLSEKARQNKIDYNIQYQKDNVKQIKLTFNINTEKDLIKQIDKQENKQGYIKKLIRQDMES